MIFEPTPLHGCYVIGLDKLADSRGWFIRTYCKNEFENIGFHKDWVQHNHTLTEHKGAIRGLHYQKPPFSETKLVRCVVGKVWDVVVDLRASSTTYLQWFSVELSAENQKMIFIPEGFAHGFQTLTPACEMLYCHSEFYHSSHEMGLMYNDPAIAVKWPLTITQISERDLRHPLVDKNFAGIN